MIAAKAPLLSWKLPDSPPEAPAALSAAMSADEDALLCDPYTVREGAESEVPAAEGTRVLSAEEIEVSLVVMMGIV